MTPSARLLEGRVALVTGAGSGIGKAIAVALAQAGAGVVVCGRTPRNIEMVERLCMDLGADALAVPCDVRKAMLVDTLVRTTVQHFGRLDTLINNAGIMQITSLETTDEELWDGMLETNLKGPYLVTRSALQYLKEARGHIVNVSSVAGRESFSGSTAYCASKWGLMGFTNALRKEMRPHGVRVSAVLPGAVDTPLWDDINGDWQRSTMLEPDTVARAVVDLLQQPAGASVDEVVLTPSQDKSSNDT